MTQKTQQKIHTTSHPSKIPASDIPPSDVLASDVPAKFWDTKKGHVRVDALLKAYKDLERCMESRNKTDIPLTPEDYDMPPSSAFGDVPPELKGRLHAAGFTHVQAQLVWKLADEYIMPMLEKVSADFVQKIETDKLIQHFGNADSWVELARQLAT